MRPAPYNADLARAIAHDMKDMDGALMPILHEFMERFGHVPQDAVPILADVLNLSRAEVHGVVTFYHEFRRAPAGRHVVKVCRAEACQAVGGRALEAHAQARLRAAFGETSADRRYTLDPIYCFGNCACGPSVMIDGKLHGRVSPERFDALMSAAEARP